MGITMLLAVMVAAVGATPVGAQELGVLEVSPHEGPVGSVVEGFVPPEAVAECPYDAAGPAGTEGTLQFAWNDGGFAAYVNNVILPWALSLDPESLEFGVAGVTLLGLLTQVQWIDQVFEASHVLTFADVESQETVGDTSSFDPATGEGVVEVPDVAPGLWAVVATCLPLPDLGDIDMLAMFEIAVDEGVLFWDEHPDAEGTEIAEVVLLAFFPQVLMAGLDAAPGPWIDLFCVQDADGQCHPSLRDIELAEELLGGDDPFLDGLADGDLPAEAVGTTPRFTG